MVSQNSGHRQRLKDKFSKSLSLGFNDYELLELLLTYSIPLKDVKPLAKLLIAEFGSLSSVFDAKIDDLLRIDGIGKSTAILIALVHELRLECKLEKLKERDTISSSSDLHSYVREKLSGELNENFLTIFLDSKNRVIANETIAEGSIAEARIYPRKIVKLALKHNASGIILVHNHPSGDSTPSNNDFAVSKVIKDVCEPMDIRLLDHVIVGKDGFSSCL